MQKTFAKCRKAFLQKKLKGDTYLKEKYGPPCRDPDDVPEIKLKTASRVECPDKEYYSGDSDDEWFRNPEFPDYSNISDNEALENAAAWESRCIPIDEEYSNKHPRDARETLDEYHEVMLYHRLDRLQEQKYYDYPQLHSFTDDLYPEEHYVSHSGTNSSGHATGYPEVTKQEGYHNNIHGNINNFPGYYTYRQLPDYYSAWNSGYLFSNSPVCYNSIGRLPVECYDYGFGNLIYPHQNHRSFRSPMQFPNRRSSTAELNIANLQQNYQDRQVPERHSIRDGRGRSLDNHSCSGSNVSEAGSISSRFNSDYKSYSGKQFRSSRSRSSERKLSYRKRSFDESRIMINGKEGDPEKTSIRKADSNSRKSSSAGETRDQNQGRRKPESKSRNISSLEARFPRYFQEIKFESSKTKHKIDAEHILDSVFSGDEDCLEVDQEGKPLATPLVQSQIFPKTFLETILTSDAALESLSNKVAEISGSNHSTEQNKDAEASTSMTREDQLRSLFKEFVSAEIKLQLEKTFAPEDWKNSCLVPLSFSSRMNRWCLQCPRCLKGSKKIGITNFRDHFLHHEGKEASSRTLSAALKPVKKERVKQDKEKTGKNNEAETIIIEEEEECQKTSMRFRHRLLSRDDTTDLVSTKEQGLDPEKDEERDESGKGIVSTELTDSSTPRTN